MPGKFSWFHVLGRDKGMKIIVGLGNPTSEYQGTRHNIGFSVIDRLSDEYRISVSERKFKGLCGRGMIGADKVLLVKPQTYMNLSGESVVEALHYYKCDPEEDLIVIYDDIDLDVGRLRVRGKGSAGGHNGMKNIIAHIGTETFARIRVGVGAKPPKMDLADYVLGHFHAEEMEAIEEGRKLACDAAAVILSDGVEAAMNRYNAEK